MNQPVYEELPPMSIKIRKLRMELMEANGMHLIYNVPRRVTGLITQGPLVPFPGLCVAFLLYLPKDNAMFCVQMGVYAKRYVIGWVNDTVWGMYSMSMSPYGWLGPRGPKQGATFPKGYIYLYFYFKSKDNFNGWVNDQFDLKDDSVKPFPVSDIGTDMYLGFPGWDETLIYEIHYVAWGSSHNREKGPEPAVMEKLFPRSTTGMIDFKAAAIFEMRTGTMVTIYTKYKKHDKSKHDGFAIGIGCATCTNQKLTTKVFENYTAPDGVYKFQLRFTHKGALIHTKDGVSYVTMASYNAFPAESRGYFTLENANPVTIKVETMGQMWG